MDSFRVEQVMPIHSEKKSLFVVPGLYPCAVGGAEVFNEALIRKLALESDIEYISTCDTLIPHANRIHLPKSSAILQLFFIFFRLTKVHRDRTIVTSYMRTKWYYIAIYPLLSFFLKKTGFYFFFTAQHVDKIQKKPIFSDLHNTVFWRVA